MILGTGSSSESPKEFPPRNQLIPLKPIKLAEKSKTGDNVPSTSYAQFANAPLVKQKYVRRVFATNTITITFHDLKLNA